VPAETPLIPEVVPTLPVTPDAPVLVTPVKPPLLPDKPAAVTLLPDAALPGPPDRVAATAPDPPAAAVAAAALQAAAPQAAPPAGPPLTGALASAALGALEEAAPAAPAAAPAQATPPADLAGLTPAESHPFAPRLSAPAGPAPAGSSLLAVLASYVLPGGGPVPASTTLLLLIQLAVILAALASGPRPWRTEALVAHGLVAARPGCSLALSRPG
jgi:hypothetical protein